jgi:hypothetical protein
MRIRNPVADHGRLKGLGDNDHTQYLQKAGGDVTGDISLDNNVKLLGKESDATERYIAYISTSNTQRLGDPNIPLVLYSSGRINAQEGGNAGNIITEYRLYQLIKTADETVNNSATLQDDDHLTFLIGANETWLIELKLFYESSTTADLKIAFSVPTGATCEGRMVGAELAAGTYTDTFTNPRIYNGGGATVEYMVTGNFIYRGGANSGYLTLQWAQNTAEASDTKVLAGSMMILRRIA